MTAVDRWLQRYRIWVARRWVPRGARLLDIGCHQGELLTRLAPSLSLGVGIDPKAKPRNDGHIRILRDSFPHTKLGARFDVITLLAVVEHLADPAGVADACRSLLAPAGRIVVTVPSPLVDRILSVLLGLRLIDGMSLDEHHSFHPADTVATFERFGLQCVWAARFQCGLNNLFVFEHARPAAQRTPEVNEGERTRAALA